MNFLPCVLALENLVADAFEGPGNLGNQNHVAAAGDAGVQRDPAGVSAHHFQHEHPLVAGGRRVQAIEGVGRAVDRAIEAERERRGREVVVDRLGHADDRDAEFVELLGDRQRAVAADANQSFEVQLLDRRGDAFEQLGLDFDAIVHADGGGEAALVRRAENRAALVEDAGRVLRRERDVLHGIVEAFVALEKADAVVAEAPAGLRRAANHRVESGAVAAAGENADSFVAHDRVQRVVEEIVAPDKHSPRRLPAN